MENDFTFNVLDPVIDSEDFLLDLRNTCLILLHEGKTVLEYESATVKFKKAFGAPLRKIVMECTRALKLKNPGLHGNLVRQSIMLRTR